MEKKKIINQGDPGQMLGSHSVFHEAAQIKMSSFLSLSLSYLIASSLQRRLFSTNFDCLNINHLPQVCHLRFSYVDREGDPILRKMPEIIRKKIWMYVPVLVISLDQTLNFPIAVQIKGVHPGQTISYRKENWSFQLFREQQKN